MELLVGLIGILGTAVLEDARDDAYPGPEAARPGEGRFRVRAVSNCVGCPQQERQAG